MAPTSTSKVVRSEALMSTLVGDDMVLLHLAKNCYVGLNPIARRLWELLETPRLMTELVDQMEAEFQGDPATIAADILDFVTELERDGLVSILET